MSEVAFAIALSGGGLSPAETELFDSEYELTKAGYTADEVKDALAFQKLKKVNDDEYDPTCADWPDPPANSRARTLYQVKSGQPTPPLAPYTR